MKKQIAKLLSVFLSFSIAFSSVIPVYATETNTSTSTESSTNYDSRDANYFVSIPKSITLNEDKQAVYSIKVSGNIASNQQVYVSPVDGIEDTEELDFYMEDTIVGSTKQNTVAKINQNKFYWNSEEVADAYVEADNNINISSISAGLWRGTFQIEINLLTDNSHIHSYTETVTKEPTCTEDGEKTYACECGDSYAEVIPATGHNYVDNTTDNNHICSVCKNTEEHDYSEEITKEATCTEDGEKVCTCSVCGKSYTETIPAYGSHIDEDEDNICDRCGHKHIWEENVDVTSWGCVSTVRATQSNNTWTIAYGKYYSVASARWTITVPEDIEYTMIYFFDYDWNSPSDKLTVTLDDKDIISTSSYGSKTYVMSLSAGTHTLNARVNRGNTKGVSGYAAITLEPINKYNHICKECGDKEEHIYNETIIKPATCYETGERLFTCIKCGHNYTEVIPVDGGHHIDEDKDDICDKCGHKHIWEENTDSIAWDRQLPSSSLKQSGNTWTLDKDNATQYSTYQIHGNWKATVPLDAEYIFNYSSGFVKENDRVRIYVDDELVVDFANSSNSGSEKIFLTAGTHVIQMYLDKNNQTSSATYAKITLDPVVILDHICTECNEKELHSYTEKILTAPTCTEKGEKELTCIKCGHTHTEEIEPTGHDYVDNTVGVTSNHKCTVCGNEEEHIYDSELICTVCGHFRGEYTLVFNSESKIGSIAENVDYEYEKVYLSDGDEINLPDVSSPDCEFEGWYFAKGTEQPVMHNKGLSHVLYGSYNDAYDCWYNPDVRVYSLGSGVHVTKYGEDWYTNYEYQNTATTDVFTIENPSVYDFKITEKQYIFTKSLKGGYSMQYTLNDITNGKSYDLRNLPAESKNDQLYDFGNIKIKCRKDRNASMGDDSIWKETANYYYTVYFEPGEYEISLYARCGGTEASPTESYITVDMYGVQSSFYELHPLTDGESFDASVIYTTEGSKEIYCIPKWTSISNAAYTTSYSLKMLENIDEITDNADAENESIIQIEEDTDIFEEENSDIQSDIEDEEVLEDDLSDIVAEEALEDDSLDLEVEEVLEDDSLDIVNEEAIDTLENNM